MGRRSAVGLMFAGTIVHAGVQSISSELIAKMKISSLSTTGAILSIFPKKVFTSDDILLPLILSYEEYLIWTVLRKNLAPVFYSHE